MGRRREPGQREYNPLDDARGRLPIESELVRDVLGNAPAPELAPRASQSSVKPEPDVETHAPVLAQEREGKSFYAHGEEAEHYRPARKLAIERLTKYNKFLTTPSEKLELERLAARMSGALGVSVKSSQVIRACLIQLLHSESEIIRMAEKMDPPKRPSNAEAVGLAEFDQILAALLSQAFRQTKPIKVA